MHVTSSPDTNHISLLQRAGRCRALNACQVNLLGKDVPSEPRPVVLLYLKISPVSSDPCNLLPGQAGPVPTGRACGTTGAASSVPLCRTRASRVTWFPRASACNPEGKKNLWETANSEVKCQAGTLWGP